MIWHMGVNSLKPCHICIVEKSKQCDCNLEMEDNLRDLQQTVLQILNGYAHRLREPPSVAKAKQMQTASGFYNDILPPAFWSKFFNPLWNTPPCLMHMFSLGLIREMMKNFADIHGYEYVTAVNALASSRKTFPGIPATPYGIYCERSPNHQHKQAKKQGKKGMWTLRKLNADQILGFARSSISYLWTILPRDQFELWLLVLRWCLRLYSVEFNQEELDCGSFEIDICNINTSDECLRHMSRGVVI